MNNKSVSIGHISSKTVKQVHAKLMVIGQKKNPVAFPYIFKIIDSEQDQFVPGDQQKEQNPEVFPC